MSDSQNLNSEANLDAVNKIVSATNPHLKIVQILECVIDGVYAFGHTTIPKKVFDSPGLTIVNGYDLNADDFNQSGKSKLSTTIYWIIQGEDIYSSLYGVLKDDVINYNLDRGAYGHLLMVDRFGQKVLIQRYRNYKSYEGGPVIYTSTGEIATARSTGVTLRFVDSGEFLHKDTLNEEAVQNRIDDCLGYSKTLLRLAMVVPQEDNPAQILLKSKNGDAAQKALFDELANTGFTVPALEMVKSDVKIVNEAIVALDRAIEVLYGKLNSHQKDVEGLRTSSEEFSKQLNREADRLINERNALTSVIAELESEIVSEESLKLTKDQIDQSKTKLSSLREKLSAVVADTSLEIAYANAKKDLETATRATEFAKNAALAVVGSVNKDGSNKSLEALTLNLVSGVGIDEALANVESSSADEKLANEKSRYEAEEALKTANATIEELAGVNVTVADEDSFRKNHKDAEEKVLSIKTEVSKAQAVDPSFTVNLNSAQNALNNAKSQISSAKESVNSLKSAMGDSESEAEQIASLKALIGGSSKPTITKEALQASKKQFEAAISKIKNDIAIAEGNAQTIRDLIKDHKSDTCYACKQAVSGDSSSHAHKSLADQKAKLANLESEIEKQKARIPNGEQKVLEVTAQIELSEHFTNLEVLEKAAQGRSNLVASLDLKTKEVSKLEASLPNLESSVTSAKSALDLAQSEAAKKAATLKSDLDKSEEVCKAMKADLDAVILANKKANETIKQVNLMKSMAATAQSTIASLMAVKTAYEILVEKDIKEKIAAVKESIAAYSAAFVEESKAKKAFESEKSRVSEEKASINAELMTANEELDTLNEQLVDLNEKYAKSEQTKAEIVTKKALVATFATKLEMLSAQENPYIPQIEAKMAVISSLNDEVTSSKNQITEKKARLREFEYIKWLFSPEGLRSFMMDPLIDKLNMYVKEYLDEMFFGKVGVTWSSVKTGKSGTSNEISVQIYANGGYSKLGLISGAEKDYPSTAINLAVARIAEENMGVRAPFRSFDELLKQISEPGQHRVMSLLNRISRENNQKFFLVTHNKTLKRFAQNEIWVIKKNNISYLSQHPEGLEGEMREYALEKQRDPHSISAQETVKEMIAEGAKKKRTRKPKTEVAS